MLQIFDAFIHKWIPNAIEINIHPQIWVALVFRTTWTTGSKKTDCVICEAAIKRFEMFYLTIQLLIPHTSVSYEGQKNGINSF